jgi:hypothetical protein
MVGTPGVSIAIKELRLSFLDETWPGTRTSSATWRPCLRLQIGMIAQSGAWSPNPTASTFDFESNNSSDPVSPPSARPAAHDEPLLSPHISTAMSNDIDRLLAKESAMFNTVSALSLP